jgi:hypothetical protein
VRPSIHRNYGGAERLTGVRDPPGRVSTAAYDGGGPHTCSSERQVLLSANQVTAERGQVPTFVRDALRAISAAQTAIRLNQRTRLVQHVRSQQRRVVFGATELYARDHSIWS